jgi:hypothetical protein
MGSSSFKARFLALLSLCAMSAPALALVRTLPSPATPTEPIRVVVERQYSSEARISQGRIERTGNRLTVDLLVEVACSLPNAPLLRADFDVGILPVDIYEVEVRIADRGLPGLCPDSSAVENGAFAVSEVGTPIPISRFYGQLLGRPTDPQGAAFWSGELQRGLGLGMGSVASYRSIATELLRSPEYMSRARSDADFVADLYAGLLAREGEGPGITYWTEQLAAGLPREAAVQAFLASAEFEGFVMRTTGLPTPPQSPEAVIVAGFYLSGLGRFPDAVGWTFWTGRLGEARCRGPAAVARELESLSDAFLEGGEYESRARNAVEYVTDLYHAVLGRPGDADGVGIWARQIGSGSLTRSQLQRAFRETPEFQARIAAIAALPCL